jgi:hypothetical protein
MINKYFSAFQMKVWLYISSLLILAFNLTAQDISYHLPIDSSGVAKILSYNLNQLIQNDIEYVNRKINDRVFLETHLGAGYYSDISEQAILGIKFNILNPKLPYYSSIKARVFKIRRLSRLLNGGLDSASGNRLSEIESLLAQYDKNKWKRFSISITTPVAMMNSDTSYNWSYVDSSYHPYVRSYYNPHILRIYGFSLGYDIGDIATVDIGSTLNSPRQIYGSVTFDISTPSYLVLSSFTNHIRSLIYPNLPGTQNLDNNW